MPFEVPYNWQWCKLNSVGTMVRGNGIKRTETVDSGYPCIRYGEIYTSFNHAFSQSKSYVDISLYDKCKKIKCHDLVFTLTGENKVDIAKTIVYKGEQEVAAGGDLAIWSNHSMNSEYLSYLMASPLLINQKSSSATGDIIVHISCDKVGNFYAPIPPLNEQNRIVKSLEKLTPLIEQYSNIESKLNILNQNIKDKLKKSILQYAIEGKLVEQDPNDEPVSILLDRIHNEKEQLIKEGKIKRNKNESIIFRRDNSYYEILNNDEQCINDEIPFELPSNWMWCRLGTITNILGGKRIPAGRKLTTENTGHVYIRVSDMKNRTISLNDLHYVPDDIYPSISKYIINKEDLYITVAGTIGNVGIIPSELDSANLTENANRIVIYCINQEWLLNILDSELVQNQIKEFTTKVGQPKLAIKRIEQLLIPLAPIEEQRRIVAKLNYLMEYVSSME